MRKERAYFGGLVFGFSVQAHKFQGTTFNLKYTGIRIVKQYFAPTYFGVVWASKIGGWSGEEMLMFYEIDRQCYESSQRERGTRDLALLFALGVTLEVVMPVLFC